MSDAMGWENGSIVPLEAEADDIRHASEALDDGLDAETKKVVQVIAYSVAADLLSPILLMIINSKNRALTCDLLASVFGLALRGGWSDVDLAGHYGTSKENILNHKRRIESELGIKVITRANKQNTAIYAKTNFRQVKKEY